MVRVKICGITNRRDAEDAVSSGADALGFIFANSPRRVSVARAREIVRAVGPWVATVGVFVDASAGEIVRIASECRLSAVQLHGGQGPALAKKLAACPFWVIKVFAVGTRSDLRGITGTEADAFLFDTKVEGKAGGTGKTFDWRILKTERFGKPLIVSGGLNPANVAGVIRMLSPYGVDVSSSLESYPGKKDPKKVKLFIQNAKRS